MKKIYILLILLICINNLPGFSQSKNYQARVVFSENFEGDLSRWRPFFEGGKMRNYEKDSYINKYVEMTVSEDNGDSSYRSRIESIAFPVTGGKTYTVAADMRGMGEQIGYIVFLDENGYRLDNMGYKFGGEADNEKWRCEYSFVEAPESAKKASVMLMGNKNTCDYDNVIVCEEVVSFSSKFDSRKKYSPLATENSVTEAEKYDFVFSETFETGSLEDWIYPDIKSKNKIRKSDANPSTGRKSLIINDDMINKVLGVSTPCFDVWQGADYELSADIYKQEATHKSVDVKLNFYDYSGLLIYSVTLNSSEKGWRKCTLEVNVPYGAKNADISIESGSGSAVAYVDNLYLVNKTSATREAMGPHKNINTDLKGTLLFGKKFL